MPYKLIKNQLGGADICQILILIAVVVVVYYLFIQSQPAVESSNTKKKEGYSQHYDIAVSENSFTTDEENNRKNRPAVDITYPGVPYYHIPSRLTSENTYATPEETEKNESKSRLAVVKTYKRERDTDKKDEILGRKKMDKDFGIVVDNPRVYRTFTPSSVAYSPPFDTTSVLSIVSDTVPVSSTSGRSYSSSSSSKRFSSKKSKKSKKSKNSKKSKKSKKSKASVSASYTVSPPDYISTPPSSGKAPGGNTTDRTTTIGTVTSTPSTPVVTSSLTIPKSVTPTQPSSIISSLSSVTSSETPKTPSSVSSPASSSVSVSPSTVAKTVATPTTATTATTATTSTKTSTPSTPSTTVTTSTTAPKVIEKFTDVNKLYSAQDGYDLKTPLSKSLCSQKCCGYYWKENMDGMFKRNDTVKWEDVGVGKKYRTSNVTCMGDGVAPPGCRCYTGEQKDLLSTRGGNGSRYY